MWTLYIYTASEETKTLVSYSEERFDKEPQLVRDTRNEFAIVIWRLIDERNKLERGEATRNLQIAITHLEDSCMRAVKAFYLTQ